MLVARGTRNNIATSVPARALMPFRCALRIGAGAAGRGRPGGRLWAAAAAAR
eukprot:SAG25_NODE_196_length_12129_cov_57.802826_1_plen_51_part_10